MAQPKVSFTLGQGGSGRPLAGFDHYSAMIAYDYGASADADYTNIGNKTYTSPEDAEADGIVDTCAEATAATSLQTVTDVGADDDTVETVFTDWNGTEIDLGTYTKITSDSVVDDVADGITAAINARTYITGFSAVAAGGASGEYTITAPKSYGTYPNTKSVVTTITGTVEITDAAFTGGTVSKLAQWHYQISEFFRGNPLGVLYFSIKWDDSSQAAAAFNAQVQEDGLAVANAFKGQARRILFYNPFRTFATSTLTALKALRTTLFNQYTPATMFYFGAYTGALSAQANARALTADGVAPIIGQSGTGVGLDLSYTQQTAIGSAGLALGIKSAAAVSQSIAEVGAFNLSDGSECEEAHFFDRTDYETISTALGDQLHDYGYIFLKKFKGGFEGTYFNAGNTAVSPSSDYAYLEDSETIDKAVRGVYLSILPLLNKKNLVNADGTLSEAAIASYNEKCDVPLAQMERDQDISGYSVLVDRTAVVATTGVVPINIKLQQTPISREISITIGFVATI